MTGFRSDYRIEEWKNHRELEAPLNRLCNEGWRVDNHKLDNDDAGWTIFSKHIQLDQPLLERTINVGEVYRILNRVFPVGEESVREFDRSIKAAVYRAGDSD
jgi:hypothetical protein